MLSFPGDLTQPVGQFSVNFSPVTDREDPTDPRFALQLVAALLQILHPKDFLKVRHMLFQLVAELGADDIIRLALKLRRPYPNPRLAPFVLLPVTINR